MKLSIITVNLNNGEGLQKTIDSVIRQTYKDFEFLIIDGGSNDGSLEIIKRYAGAVNYWVSEPDTGIYNAMNKGIRKATGDYLLFLNSGDSLNDSTVLSRAEIHCNGLNEILLGNKYNTLKGQTLSHPDRISLYYCIYKRFFAHQSAFIKRSVLEQYGLYSEHYNINSDYEFFLKSLGMGGVQYKKLDFVVSNFDGSGISSIEKNQPLIKAEIADIIARNVPASILNDYDRIHRFGEFKMKYLDEIVANKFLDRVCGIVLFGLYKINKLFK